jgi:hypothetical protein
MLNAKWKNHSAAFRKFEAQIILKGFNAKCANGAQRTQSISIPFENTSVQFC